MRTVLGRWLKLAGYGVVMGLAMCSLIPTGPQANLHADSSSVSVWWPVEGIHASGVQPFKAVIPGLDPSNYRVTWKVDGGNENQLADSYQDSPHKEALVDLSGWTWNGSGPYKVVFTAYNQSGTLLGTQTTDIYTGDEASAPSQAPTSSPVPAAAKVATPISSIVAESALARPVPKSQFYATPNDSALSTATAWNSSRPADAAILQRIGSTPTAQWFGGWNGNVGSDVDSLVSAAAESNKVPVLVAYNIPNRDCGSYSGGGASADGYASWIRAFASGLKGRTAEIILEPDALAQVSCLNSGDQTARFNMLLDAVNVLKADTSAKVYIDGGHAGWVEPATMASRLNQSGLSRADGFSLNVSNFGTTQANSVYGHAISALTGGKHFVIDTSRNGRGGTADGQWCNPSNQALGLAPTTATNDATIDAYLWLKTPGESDGACNGGPSAGTWWPDYALTLGKNAGY